LVMVSHKSVAMLVFVCTRICRFSCRFILLGQCVLLLLFLPILLSQCFNQCVLLLHLLGQCFNHCLQLLHVSAVHFLMFSSPGLIIIMAKLQCFKSVCTSSTITHNQTLVQMLPRMAVHRKALSTKPLESDLRTLGLMHTADSFLFALLHIWSCLARAASNSRLERRSLTNSVNT
jgi:hypothetical protein